jgi:hypothetical protein
MKIASTNQNVDRKGALIYKYVWSEWKKFDDICRFFLHLAMRYDRKHFELRIISI